MFTIAQISAIIGLLMAFGVPQQQVDVVEAIMSGPEAVEQLASSTPNFGSIQSNEPVVEVKKATSVTFVQANSALNGDYIEVQVGDVPTKYEFSVEIYQTKQGATGPEKVGESLTETKRTTRCSSVAYGDKIERCLYNLKFSPAPVPENKVNTENGGYDIALTYNGITRTSNVSRPVVVDYKDMQF